jgi:hypothetical protein
MKLIAKLLGYSKNTQLQVLSQWKRGSFEIDISCMEMSKVPCLNRNGKAIATKEHVFEVILEANRK